MIFTIQQCPELPGIDFLDKRAKPESAPLFWNYIIKKALQNFHLQGFTKFKVERMGIEPMTFRLPV